MKKAFLWLSLVFGISSLQPVLSQEITYSPQVEAFHFKVCDNTSKGIQPLWLLMTKSTGDNQCNICLKQKESNQQVSGGLLLSDQAEEPQTGKHGMFPGKSIARDLPVSVQCSWIDGTGIKCAVMTNNRNSKCPIHPFQ